MFVRSIPLLLLLAGCPQAEEDGDTDPGPADDTGAALDSDTTQPAPQLDGTEGAIQDLLGELADHAPGYGDAASRLIDAYLGGSPDGVTLSPPGPSRSGTLNVDVDLDGTYDEDWALTLTAAQAGGPVQLIASTVGSLRDAAPNLSLSTVLSVEGASAFASQTSLDVYRPAISFHGSNGDFQFGAEPSADGSVGTMSYVAYSGETSDPVYGDVEVIAESTSVYTIRVTFDPASPGRRSVPATSTKIGCDLGLLLYVSEWQTVCDHGAAPSASLTAGLLLALVGVRRRQR